ncbi:MAG: SPOR domain-containing protein [Prevotella sp.]|nr:SPOR domain-containing protein [Prevotella sp.]
MEKRLQIIKRVLSVLPFCFFTFLPLSAQSYLEHLQQKTQGLGTVSVHQSKEIDDLVNGAVPVAKPVAKTTTSPTQNTTANTEKTAEEEKKEEPKERVALKPDMPKTETESGTEVEVDMSKKVMRNSYKVTGFRVQAFAGGNTREDKRKAEEARDKIKRAYPSEPVYVHFYSPRWICRVGNYRTQEEANRMLRNIRNLGYRQAVVVKGKITVQY